ncbi:MAG: ureidoglycolate lyase [Pseudomonadales bacterium]
MKTLVAQPLTAQAFKPFGDVIETQGRDWFSINNGSTERYHHLSEVDLAEPGDRAIINIFRASALEMPLRIEMMERHPRGSQAFIPLRGQPFVVVVAEAGAPPRADQLRAFTVRADQGVNYRQGVWHHPIICLAAQDDFLVIDRLGEGNNCDEHFFAVDEQLQLHIPETGVER